jgi:fructosamine-3-kinase
MTPAHPLTARSVVAAVEQAASAHRGSRWTAGAFADLNDRASHPCGIFDGQPFSVFAKLSCAPEAREQFTAELAGLRLLREAAQVTTPVPVGMGMAGVTVAAGECMLLLTEALPERPPADRRAADWESIGRVLAALHRVRAGRFGLPGQAGFFGPLRQDNTPVRSGRWADFYAERRLVPHLRLAVDSGSLPPELAAGLQRVTRRLPELCGPEPVPSLLHGDAQQHNFISTPAGAAVIDAAPYYGHPELDLALLDYFHPVPAAVLDAYREHARLDPGFAGRRELWRLAAYLAVIASYGSRPWGRTFLERLARAVRGYL